MGCIVDGCPAGMILDTDIIQADLDRRRPGSTTLGTKRNEPDELEILSGVYEGRTLGTPIAMLVKNKDARSRDYDKIAKVFRPSHADYTYAARFGHRDPRGGGRASARETVARVAAGGVARQLLDQMSSIQVVAWVDQVGTLVASVDTDKVLRSDVDKFPVRCPDENAAQAMQIHIEEARKARDTVGGVIGVVARNVPAGLGAPVFEKLDATIAAAMMSLPAAKGVEIGSGFSACLATGSTHNDAFVTTEDDSIRTQTNHSGGIQGGISNGMPILARVGFKPVATHFLPQQTVTTDGEATTFTATGRHDPCVLPRAVPMIESMLLLVLADAALAARIATL